MEYLPGPEVLESCWAEEKAPPLAAMRLHWDPNMLGAAERVWRLPEGIALTGPAPERFGVTIVRRDLDAYSVRLLWNDIRFDWTALTRTQLLTTSLVSLLHAMGQDLWTLLNQPIHAVISHPRKAA
jgi:hypothetical protein